MQKIRDFYRGFVSILLHYGRTIIMGSTTKKHRQALPADQDSAMKRASNEHSDLQARRDLWQHRGQRRPDFAVPPRPGQESVWDYPRPPAIVPDNRWVEVRLGEMLIARSQRVIRVLETASPPTFYLPREDVDMSRLTPARGHSFCEWKGQADYFDLLLDDTRRERVAWSYEQPFAEFTAIRGYLSFYPDRVECFVAAEPVRAQQGGFYGGWVTDEIVGPYKGEPGTGVW
jgi:uncharacterized protein (DUF427 family)